ncbi:hypothetical protein [Sphingobacterium multivorum]|uniref:hypothetical protein n=1 Tax=Sphingobacterium multivorum TaxID=28454 RepID=UPI002899D03B|nr:hypothetical protein [Sphingobacterium multivorum]
MKEYEFNNPLLLQDAILRELDRRKYRRIISNNSWITLSMTRNYCEKGMQIHQHVQSLLKARGSEEQTLIDSITFGMAEMIVKEHFAWRVDYDIHVSEYSGIFEDGKMIVKATFSIKY